MKEGDILGGRYTLGDRIAGGGMGTVYIAKDERLGRRVAVKMLKEALAEDVRFVERFKREARSAAALTHPNVASVYDYGEDSGCHFIVMEYVEGMDLARLLDREGSLEPERAAAIATQAAAALGHAHAAGVIHRDVKPANIMVGAQDRVKVTDFGIARAVGDSTLTATGTIMGTASYLSPEQAQGLPLDVRSDVYSLGIVLFEMLVGEPPYTGDSAVSLAMRHMNEDVPAPSEKRPETPPELDRVVLGAAAREVDDRYANGHAMARALQEAAGTPAIAPLPLADTSPLEGETRPLLPIPQGSWDPARLGRIVLASFAGLLLLATALFIWRILQDDPTGAEERGGTTPATVAPSDEQSEAEEEEPSAIEVTDLIIGSDYETTKEILESYDLIVEEEWVPSEEDEGVVVDTEPGPGSILEAGDTITLYISNGDDPDDDEGDERGPPEHGPPGREKKDGKDDDD